METTAISSPPVREVRGTPPVAQPPAGLVTRPVPSYALRGLFVIAVLVLLKVAAPLLMPIALGVFLSLMLAPVVNTLTSVFRLPRLLSITWVICAVLAAVAAAVIWLSEPALKWSKDLPSLLPKMESKLSAVKEPMAEIEKMAEQVQELTDLADSAPVAEVVLSTPSTMETIIAEVPYILTSAAITLFLTFFLLLCGGVLVRRIAALGTRFSHRRRIVSTVRHMQGDITRFLFTISVINFSLGAFSAAVFWLLEVPNPILWGVVVALCNFAPYVGPAIALALMTAVALLSMDTLADAALVPLAFLVITIIEGQILTPMIIGRRLNLSPLVVFLAVIVWGYIWGLVGALIAVPLVASLKLMLASLPTARPFARLLSR